MTIGSFCQLETENRVVVMSTHLDHRGQTARRESAKLLLELASLWEHRETGGPPVPLFLGGDFNSTPDDAAYKEITRANNGMADVSDLISPEKRYGNREVTYTSFGEPHETPKRIDFLFVKEQGNIRFLTFGILSNQFDDKILLSDHRAVVADLEITT